MRRYVCCQNSAYGAQALALVRSLQRHEPDPAQFTVSAVCMDDGLHERMWSLVRTDKALARILKPYRWTEMAEATPGLIDCLYDGRTTVEWFWTQASQAVAWMLEHKSGPSDRVVYVDSDLWFTGDPSPVFDAWEDSGADVALHTHRFHADYADREARGRFNVGLCGFRATKEATVAARWWAKQVRRLCVTEMPALSATLPNGMAWTRAAGSAGDQGWIEGLVEFCKVHVIEHPGAAVAPYSAAWRALPEEIMWYHAHEAKYDHSGNVVKRTGYPTPQETTSRLVEPHEAAVKAAAEELWR